MLRQAVEITNKLGLHARASAKLTQLAGGFACEITLERDGKRANAKSVMAMMMMAAAKGTALVLETHGEDEAAAMSAIQALIEDKFGEGE